MNDQNHLKGQAKTGLPCGPESKKNNEPMKLVLEIHPQTLEDADRLTRRRCLQELAETLAELAFDMAQCETRPGRAAQKFICKLIQAVVRVLDCN